MRDMKEKIIAVVGVMLGLAAGCLLFFSWDPEPLLRGDESPVGLREVQEGLAEDHVGAPAGADIPRLGTAADLDAMLAGVDVATAEPESLIGTGVYSLQPWSDSFSTRTYKGRTRTGYRREQVIRSETGAVEHYSQYYLLELADGSYILAQLPEPAADALRQGEAITLPIGQKAGLTNTARDYLRDICAQYGASTDAVLYTIDDAWYAEHGNTLFLLRFGAAAVVFLVTAVGAVLLGNRLFRVDD